MTFLHYVALIIFIVISLYFVVLTLSIVFGDAKNLYLKKSYTDKRLIRLGFKIVLTVWFVTGTISFW